MNWLHYGLLGVGALFAWSQARGAWRRRQFERCFPVMRQLVADQRYREALALQERTPGLWRRHDMSPDRAIALAEVETEALVRDYRLSEAVVRLGQQLSARYVVGEWPADKLERWLALYREAGPLPVEDFYFCEVCGLAPDTEALLRYAIEAGCAPPTGFPGARDQTVVFLDSPRKVGH